MRCWCNSLSLIFALFGFIRVEGQETTKVQEQMKKAVHSGVRYLAPEVANWKDQHKCYSCHNHGDGARALFAAKLTMVPASKDAIQISVAWLRQPERWDENGPDGPFSDRKLARIQFASALATAVTSGVNSRQALLSAAEQLAGEQLDSGAWDFEGADSIGGPTTYGRTLATVQAQYVLRTADPTLFRKEISRCDDWLRKAKPRSVIDAAAVLIGIGKATDERAAAQRERCRKILKNGQTSEGGWGPYVTSAPEAFDTALAVLALRHEPDEEFHSMRHRGVEYLLRTQLSDGSWPETTRPDPRESYSQRISTTAWVLLALAEEGSRV